MRRPLFLVSFCVVLFVAWYHWRYPVTEAGPPDKSRLILYGQVIDREDASFVIRLRKLPWETHSNLPSDKIIQTSAAVLRQNYPDHQFYSGQYKKFECEYENASSLVLGSFVLLEGEFREYGTAGNPGEFDYASYYHSLDYGGRMQNIALLAQEEKAPGLREGLNRLRQFWERRLYQVFPEKEASVLTAMLLGDKSDLDAEIKTLYRKTGILHILSISGLHITLIGVGFYHRLRKWGVPVWIAALAGGGLLFLYGMLTGFGISACRAIGMYLIRMLGHIVGRTYDMLTALGVMAAGMVCVHPAWAGHMGFLLSFCSVLGVGALLPVLRSGITELKNGDRRLRKYAEILKQGFLAGVSVTLTTLPVQLWFSYEIPVYSLFLNLLLLPFMGVVLAAGLAAMLVPGLGIIGTVDVLILGLYEGVCRLFEKLPHPMWNPGRPRGWQVMVYYFIWMLAVWGIPLLRDDRRKQHSQQSYCFLYDIRGTLLCLAAAVWILVLPRLPENRMTFLDVGQGDGMCLQLASGEVYLFDCGSSSRTRIGERVLIPFLKYYGISEIDAVFISHGDADHVNGLVELFAKSGEEHIRVRQVVLPELTTDVLQEEFREVFQAIGQMPDPPAVTTIQSGVEWQSKTFRGEAVTFRCLHPQAASGNNFGSNTSGGGISGGGNADSECFLVSFPVTDPKEKQNVTVLLTGDVEGSGERELLAVLKTYQISEIDVLKCPHHGSKGTTSVELLAQITPTDTVISCGRNNRYGHPHEELLERLAAVQSRIWRTPQTGAVTVRITREGYHLTKFK